MGFKDIPQNGYERVIHVEDEASGLDAIIALHSTKLGPAIGGIRCYDYDSFDSQLTDALRLSQGMTFKNAAAGLNHGGAKTTVNASKIKDRRLAFQKLGKMVNLLDGKYICAGDVGTTVEDLFRVNDGTSYVAGITLDSSEPTALGVYSSIKALLKRDKKEISGHTFMVEGLGKVGNKLAKMLIRAGGNVKAYDPWDGAYDSFPPDLKIERVSKEDVYTTECDVYVPCALGATVNMKTLNTMKADYICGSANNQFEKLGDAEIARTLGINYVPDFVANCGGVVAVALDFQKKDATFALTFDLESRINYILDNAENNDINAQHAAEYIANQRLK
jgi:leucine dehydrogenase